MIWTVTDHAFDRWKQRIDRSGTREDVLSCAAVAVRVPDEATVVLGRGRGLRNGAACYLDLTTGVVLIVENGDVLTVYRERGAKLLALTRAAEHAA